MGIGTVANIMVAPARLLYSPVATAAPDETSVAVGGTWTSWTDLGYTLTPLALKYEADIFDLEVEQEMSPVRKTRMSEKLTFEVTLAELTAANLKLALASTSTISTTAAGAAQHGYEEVSFGGETNLPIYQYGIEGYTADSSNNLMPVRLFIWKAHVILTGDVEFSKRDATGVPVQIHAIVDTSQSAGAKLFKFQRVTAWKTA